MSRARGRRHVRSAGFTLVELTVALVAGLIVALGIVGLSHEASHTFQEEVRSSAAEAALRTAVDRLRADLGRAAYMSTGDIMADPMIAKAPTDLSNLAHISSSMKGIRSLGAIQLFRGGSMVNVLPLSGLQSPALTPDAIQIGGNLTSAEQFDVQMILPANGNCQQILLSPVSPAIYRAAKSGLSSTSSSDLNALFVPVAGAGGLPDGTKAQFIVRLMDDSGHTQYLATCSRQDVAGITGTGASAQPYVWIDAANTPIQTAQTTKTVGSLAGYAAGHAWVNPVQIVRWEITSTATEATNQPQFVSGLGSVVSSGSIDASKYDLVRSYVDATGAVVNATSELVAEYAVDLAFAFTVDNTVIGNTQPSLVSYAFDDPLNAGWAPQDLSTLSPPPSSPPALVGPQRIRSVRARIVTRAAMADRATTIPLASQFGAQAFMYRYCVSAPCATNDGTMRWARARTVTTEVSLPNNSTSFY